MQTRSTTSYGTLQAMLGSPCRPKDKDGKLLEQAAIAVSIDAVEDCPLPPSIVLRHVGNDDLFAVFFLASAVELQKWQLPAELTGKAPLPGSGSWVIAKISANRMYEIGELVRGPRTGRGGYHHRRADRGAFRAPD